MEGVSITRGLGLAGALALLGASAALAGEGRPTMIRAFKPTADTYVTAAEPDRNFGRMRSLRADGAPRATVYLRFRSSDFGEEVDTVTLLLHAVAGARRFQVRRVHEDDWREGRLTHRNAPRLSLRYTSSTPVRVGQWNAVDVTSLVEADDEELSLAITTRSPVGVVFASREAKDGPRLVVRTKGKDKGKARIQGREPTP